MKKLISFCTALVLMFVISSSVFANKTVPANVVVNDPAVVPFENIGIN